MEIDSPCHEDVKKSVSESRTLFAVDRRKSRIRCSVFRTEYVCISQIHASLMNPKLKQPCTSWIK
ncbi:uncharacterized protein BO80DRAFT_258128 [Aspergillus ibericus CBS 121593]|uniref:Uncharacterized protein n=1 Tax=Aspergillus ibericus CBS 121593 TaxID=1448316 RepID=A0A395H8E1_9EURO|nr:hypothetical protein BO80DRAFT_258128 [Aspergillus ibericus CBS 121593]RAL04211.1 hypothetical protein BO80DRAFT_258128 [Aspergillus ibericus CBS 121593]